MKTSIRAGTHIDGAHWMAEYSENGHEIRVFREGHEVGVYDAPPTLFGDEQEAGSLSNADHRAIEAALVASLRQYVAEHNREA
ncbi:hypothetical protein PXJ20_24520 [Paraburkholderia sp. A1RI_3L]|jgi:hypothetical protein|uniref:hypothetical protein n=1 Tax=Paraburkholderia TaxID=1822464 RepID=UPI0018F507B7|nr:MULTISPECIES: hypothetical protein [Paraburkholderia]WEY41426.1 hypothetical protein P2869_28615 [Paraburkholderia sp. SUR17]